jgi:membrane protease YdiL (CAAX protease family)
VANAGRLTVSPVRKTLLVLALLGLVVVGAVHATPPVHRWLVDAGLLAEEKFPKVLRRLLLIPMLLVLFAALRPWRDGGPTSYGLLGPRARARPALLAFAATAIVLLAMILWQGAEGWVRLLDPVPWGPALGRLAWWLGAGVVIALLEEWFFRGWLDRRFSRRVGPVASALLVALVFGLLHAFRPSRLGIQPTHDAAGAWEALLAWLSYLGDVGAFGPSFLGLFLASLLLTALYRRTGTLWTPVAAHAAAVWVIRAQTAFTERTVPRSWAGTKDLVDGPVGWAVLLLALATTLAARREGSGDRAAL